MSDFPIRAYSKKELALCYFPTSTNPHTAVNHLMAWVRRNSELWDELCAMGYQPSSKWLSPREVREIVRYLGEP